MWTCPPSSVQPRTKSRWLKINLLGCALVALAAASIHAQPRAQQNVDWPVYGGQQEQDHYSPLTQIDRGNVGRLRVAWQYDSKEDGGLETSPIIVGRILYACTPSQKVIALDATTGKLLWKFDSTIVGTQPIRGLSYWSDGKQSRLFAGVMNFLYALDPATGRPVDSFAENGRIDLRKALRGDYAQQSIALTAPGIVYQDLIILGGRNPEDYPSPPGDIRAFDVRTGALRWSFHTIPHPGEFGYQTWPKDAWAFAGAANNWTGMALDAKRGIVYVPTGSAVSDFYGGDRVGDDLFANTLLALDAATGKRIWHFQGVHHDIWDRDFPAPPSLLTVTHDGKRIDAIAQTTKQGFVYLFDRTNGQPLFPIENSPYPASTVPGEKASLTQPLPALPEPFARQTVTGDTLTTRTPEAHAWAVQQFKQYRSGGQFLPLSLNKETLVTPGLDGGAEWGGSAVDPATGVIYINANNISFLASLRIPPPPASTGQDIYQKRCSMCHGVDHAGEPPAVPSLIHIGQRLSDDQIAKTVRGGRGRMPAFPDLKDDDVTALIRYLAGQPAGTHKEWKEMEAAVAATSSSDPAATHAVPYHLTGYKKFYDPDGYPAVQFPWGTLNAIDLNTGRYLWKIPFGEYPELVAKGLRDTGSENYGGPVVTAGGLLFIGATEYDKKFRAFDSHTGKLLWETVLPFAGVATPATYMVDGKQFVVIAAAGGKDTPKDRGGMYVAFSLP
ncbi:MAG: PQQ-binding-like beta-propeller repeat protein [Acidobacteriota bacterium]|nr:PQQ-binding-like beta-propeller repeat protein [Acidobacteriota bacterium]